MLCFSKGCEVCVCYFHLVDEAASFCALKFSPENISHSNKPMEALDRYHEFRILKESPEALVIYKPPNVALDGDHPITVEKWLHDTQGHYLAANALSAGAAAKKEIKWVHQLDYATSGILCIAFTRPLAQRLTHCFEMRTSVKEYTALLCGHVPEESTLAMPWHIHAAIGMDPSDPQRFRMKVNGDESRSAHSAITACARGWMQVVGQRAAVTHVHVRIYTGRRHQIRVHMAHVGFPIVGDVTYNSPLQGDGAGRLMLHAARLALPVTLEPMVDRAQEVRAKKERKAAVKQKRKRDGAVSNEDLRRIEGLGAEETPQIDESWTVVECADPFPAIMKDKDF